MCGARPFGCSVVRITLIGGSSSSGATPSTSTNAASFAPTSSQRPVDERSRDTARARRATGRWRRAPAPSRARRDRWRWYVGAYPAAISSGLRSRSGTSRCSARCSTISRLGRDRPVSTKLRCRAETPASFARSSWLRRRRVRQSRSSWPTVNRDGLGDHAHRRYRRGAARDHYLTGNRPASLVTPDSLA